MPRSLAGRALIYAAGIELLLTIAFSSVASANQPSSPIRPQGRTPHATAPARRHRFVNGASCSKGADGSNAFDTGTTFTTNNVTRFGTANLAGADSSGVFEGYNNTVCDQYSAIGGGDSNVLDSGAGNTPTGAEDSFIGAGQVNALSSAYGFIGAGSENSLSGPYAFLGAGAENDVVGEYSAIVAGLENLTLGDSSFVGSGKYNEAESVESFIGSGDLNIVSNNYGFVGAGRSNYVSGEGSFIGAGGALTTKAPYNQISGTDSFIGTGDQNSASANDAFIGSGVLNSLTSAANDSVIAGGYGNTMSGQKASLGGGEQNDVNGSFATIPGGYRNEALGNESFAAGSQAEARYTGSFVWSDYVASEKAQTDSAPGEFVARASGGVYFFSNSTSSAGVHLAAGSGTWSSLSDRNAKTDVVPLDDASILAKVASLPISAWQYKTERGVRHVGPMAQDFYAAFGVGEDDRHITSIDEDGIALAAIKALRDENHGLQHEIADLHRQNRARALREAVEDQRIALLMRAMRIPNGARGREADKLR